MARAEAEALSPCKCDCGVESVPQLIKILSKAYVMREEQRKRDDHHKRAATISNAEIKMINPKGNYLLKCKIREWETTF